MTEWVIQAVVTIAFGALAGGLTNTIAIWMLFHPYEPPTVGGRPLRFLHGAVPKNQERLAKAIGRTVGQRLLTEEDLAGVLAAPEFREAFDERLQRFLVEILERERGSVHDLLPDGVRERLDPLLRELLEGASRRIAEYIASDAFEEDLRERSDGFVAAVRDEPVAELLTPAREAFLTDAVDGWIQDAVSSEGFAEAIHDYLQRAADTLLEPERTLQEVLPPGLVGSIEHAVAGYLPLALQRLGRLLEDPDTRARFQRTIHDLLHRFMQDLAFHQRVVAKLVMTEDTVDRVLETIEREGAERLGEMLREPEVQEAMSKGVNDAFVDLLRRPVRAVLGDPDGENVQEAIETMTQWVVGSARDPRTREFLVGRLHQALDRAAEHTWGDALEALPQEKVAGLLVQAARSDTVARVYGDGLERFVFALLDRPIGVPARWLPNGATARIEEAIAAPLWGWLQSQVPELVQRVDVARRVEEKVLAFPTPKMEELVRRVTDRELRLIIKLGYLLGAIIGSVLVGVDALLPRLLGGG